MVFMAGEKVYKVVVTVKDIKGECKFGYKVGDKIEIEQNPEGYNFVPIIKGRICPEAFENIYRNAFCMLFGGKIPWSLDDERTIAQTVCPDPRNLVTFELRQIGKK